jgi:hypothetical protein
VKGITSFNWIKRFGVSKGSLGFLIGVGLREKMWKCEYRFGKEILELSIIIIEIYYKPFTFLSE